METRTMVNGSEAAVCGTGVGVPCPWARLLARYPWLHRFSAHLYRSWGVDCLVGLVARGIAAWCRWKPRDYQRALTSCSCGTPGEGGTESLDRDFLCGVMARPATRAKLPAFLQGLTELDFRIHAGLLKTWIHTGILNDVLREAALLRGPKDPLDRIRPIDALVASFGRCNLACRGCYTAALPAQDSARPEQLDAIVRQLKWLNTYHVLLVGRGEPFADDASRRTLFHVVRRHPQLFFSVYTNGTMLRADDFRQLRKLPNLIPLVSLDGPESINDWRRGAGVYRKVLETFRRFRDEGLFFGYISTVFRQNWQAVVDRPYVEELIGFGCRLGYYTLFIDATADREPRSSCRSMMLDGRERHDYFQRFEQLDAAVPIPLIDVDQIETHVGCRARQGATVYVDALSGQVSPCIRTPLAAPECNLAGSSGRRRLTEILTSEAFRQFRGERPATSTCPAFCQAECSLTPTTGESSHDRLRHQDSLRSNPPGSLE